MCRSMAVMTSALALVLALLLPALGLAETGACIGSQGECQGSALLQHGFAAGRREANIAVDHEHGASKASATVAPPRHDLTNLRVPLHTDLRTVAWNMKKQHQQCTGNSPDGRLFLCGINAPYLRYFKFEKLQFTTDGVPIFNDDVFAGGNTTFVPQSSALGDVATLSWCWPNYTQPFQKVTKGDGTVVHVYTAFISNTDKMRQLTVEVANPYGDAEITSLQTGLVVPWAEKLPRFYSISGDGKLIIGSWDDAVMFMALPESEDSCSLCSEAWSSKRHLHKMYSDPDGLNLRNRYGLAKYPLMDAEGRLFKDTYKFTGKYTHIDFEGRNLFMGQEGGLRMIGADTLGAEIMPSGAISQAQKNLRYWTSFERNFESLRTSVQRFEGEEHTSGIGGTKNYQLPVTPDTGAFTTIAGWNMYYSELNVKSIKESANDILALPMSTAWVPKPDVRGYKPPAGTFVDLSRNHFTISKHNAGWATNKTTKKPTTMQGLGYAVKLNKGTLRIPLGDHTAGTPGLASPTPALSVVVSFVPNNKLGGCDHPVFSHANLSLVANNFKAFWTINGVRINGGTFAGSQWVALGFVFDGASGVIKVYRNGVLFSETATTMTDFKFDPTDMIMGDAVFQRQGSCSFEGHVSNFRIIPRALNGVEICDYAQGANCAGSINFQATNTQLQLTQQVPECTDASLNTLACSLAMHRVCYNYVAMKESVDNNVSGEVLANFGSAKIPVSVAGMPVSTGSQVTMACAPFAGPHLNVPVEFYVMQKYEPECLPVTDDSSEMLYCNLAAQKFCKAAMAAHEPTSDGAKVTGIVYEVEQRAWVTCFEADSVITPTKASLTGCDEGALGSAACMLSASAACNDASVTMAGVIQAVDTATLSVHCFSPPSNVGILNVDF